MRIRRINAKTIALSEFDELFIPLLRDILPSADPEGSQAAQERLFSSPTAGVDVEADEEWREYVEPDLRELLDSRLGIVQSDLQQLDQVAEGISPTLRIPLSHLDSWVSALNQARLALHARHQITEDEMEGDPEVDSERGYVLFQIHIYGLLLDAFVQQIERELPSTEDEAESA